MRIEEIAGTWVPDEAMHPATNIAGRRFWARGGVEGVYNGYWPTSDGMAPGGLYWLFPPEQNKPET